MDIVLMLLMMTLSLLFIFISRRIFEKNGLIYIYIIYNIIAFVLSFKIIEVLKININANIVMSTLITLLTYLMIEKLNIKDFKNLIKQTLILNIIISTLILVLSLYVGSVNDVNSINIKNLFLSNYKILIGYPIVTLINQSMILLVYNEISDITKKTNIRIMLTNLTTLMIETILFSVSSYIFNIKFTQLIVLIISNYLIKILLSFVYTPFISRLIKIKKVNL